MRFAYRLRSCPVLGLQVEEPAPMVEAGEALEEVVEWVAASWSMSQVV